MKSYVLPKTDPWSGKEIVRGKFYYAPHRRHWGVWVTYVYADGTEENGGNFVGDLLTKKAAARYCYCHNGWRKKIKDYPAEHPEVSIISKNLGKFTPKGEWIVVRVLNEDSPYVFGVGRMQVEMTSNNDGPVGCCKGKHTPYDFGFMKQDINNGITVLVIGKDDYIWRESDEGQY